MAICLCITEARRHHARVQRVGLPLPAPGALAARAGGSEGSTPGRSRQVMAGRVMAVVKGGERWEVFKKSGSEMSVI